MRKYNISFIVLTVLVSLAVFKGFTETGSPFTQKALSEDSKILSKMTNLKYNIDSYYQTNGKLPDTLDELDQQAYPSSMDQNANVQVDYKKTGENAYSLCATFLTDTKSEKSSYRDYTTSYVAGVNYYHPKGYDCLNLKTAPKVNYGNPAQANDGWQSLLGTYIGDVESVAKSDTEPKMIVTIGHVEKIVFVKNTELLDKSGKKITLDDFLPGDRVIVDTTFTQDGLQYKASQVQNLSK